MKLDDLLSMPDVDAVDICLPTPHHLDACLAALASGKHVLCEKPLARTAADAQKISDAAAKSKGFFMPAMCMRFWPQWAWLKDAVDSGTYGRVLSASFSRMAAVPPGWYSNGEQSGGAILDLHIHDTDFIHYLFGPPRAVFSRGHTLVSGCVDHVHTQYLYDGGLSSPAPLVIAQGGWSPIPGYPFHMSYEAHFEKAVVKHDTAALPSFTLLHEGQVTQVPMTGDGYTGELAYFLQCVRAGIAPSRVTALDAVASIRTVEAEKKSIETGRSVEL